MTLAVLVGIHHKQITHGLVAPLQSTVNIEIVALGIVLEKCGQEKIIGECKFKFGTYEKQFEIEKWFREI